MDTDGADKEIDSLVHVSHFRIWNSDFHTPLFVVDILECWSLDPIRKFPYEMIRRITWHLKQKILIRISAKLLIGMVEMG